jgi:hypothetical protein
MIRALTSDQDQAWPALPLAEWQDTYDTLHMWTQIAGKVRLALSPHVNHWWEAPLYVNARGLTTSPIPYEGEIFEVQFDFVNDELDLVVSWGGRRTLPLVAQSVADFYRRFMDMLHALGIDVEIWPMPVEVPNPIRFDQDRTHAAYDPAYAHRFWRILLTVDTIFKEFRSRFIGKDSPVHFFWGSFDLAVSRFSGRRAPERPGADVITREAYSHEVSSAGFWPGGGDIAGPAFYSYAVPEPAGFREARVEPPQARYDAKLSEFLLMYDDVRTSGAPETTLLDFLQSTYQAAAELGKWDRDALEKPHRVGAPIAVT